MGGGKGDPRSLRSLLLHDAFSTNLSDIRCLFRYLRLLLSIYTPNTENPRERKIGIEITKLHYLISPLSLK